MNVFITSNGCPRRLLDSSKLAQYFILNKCQIVNGPEIADYIVFVTCSFIKEKEEQCWEYIKKFKKYRGELIIVGCLPEIIPVKFNQEFKGRYVSTKNLAGIDAFFEKFEVKMSDIQDTGFPYVVPQLATQKIPSDTAGWAIRVSHKFFDLLFSKRTISGKISFLAKKIKYKIRLLLPKDKYAWLRLGNGCLENCAYCCIVRAIGPLKSKPIKTILEEYKALLEKGYRKFILLADNTGAYGLDIKSSFAELLENLSAASGNYDVAWHLEQIHPRWVMLYKDEIMKMIREKKIRKISCSIQSGSDRILKLMNRHHTIEDFEQVVAQLKECNPRLRLRTEIIIGFPTETDEDFSATLTALKKMQFNFVYVYPYYDGYGTIASGLSDKVAQDVIEKRMKIARQFLYEEHMTEYGLDW